MLLKRLKRELKKGAAHTLEIIVISSLLLFFILAPIVYFNIINTNNNLANVYNNILQLAATRGGIDDPLLQTLQQELVERGLVRANQIHLIQVSCTSNGGTDCRQQMLDRPSSINEDYVINLGITLPPSGWQAFLSGVNNLISITSESPHMLTMGGSVISQRDEAEVNTMPLEYIYARPLMGITSPVRAVVPNTNINNGNVFTSSLSWNISPALFTGVNPATFDYSKQYVATIVLAANNGFSFPEEFSNTASISGWLVNGVSPSRFLGNTRGQLMFEVTFPQTSNCPLNTFGSWGTISETHHERNCTQCSYRQDQPHIWPTTGGSLNNGWQQGDDANHTRVCTAYGCTQVETANHNMSTLGTWANLNANQHTRTRHCNVCNRQMTNENANHAWGYWTWDTTNHWERCGTAANSSAGASSRCGTTRNSAAHTWPDYGNWVSQNATQHGRSRTCSHANCNATQSEVNQNHVFAMTIGDQWNHWESCGTANNTAGINSRCGVTRNPAAHNANTLGAWTNQNATHHTRTRHCSVCNRNMGNENAEHRTSGWWNHAAGGVCARSCLDCNVHLEHLTHAHSIWTDIHDGTHCVINCTRCGAAHLHVANHHEHSSGWWNLGDGHHCARNCNLCGRHLEYVGHAHSVWTDINDGTHCVTNCTRCGAQHINVAAHWSHVSGWWNNAAHNVCTRSCNLCGRWLEHVGHAHSAWTDIHDGTHCAINCTRCGAQYLDLTLHEWHSSGWWDIGDGHHCARSCNLCGRHLEYAYHWNHASGWIDNGDGVHCHRRCNLCNRYMGSQVHTWHAWGHGDITNHHTTCSSCGRFAAEGHSWQLHQQQVRQEHICFINRCNICNRLDYKDHQIITTVGVRTFLRTNEGCAFRAGPCHEGAPSNTCGWNPRFAFWADGAPRRMDAGVTPHRWTGWYDATTFTPVGSGGVRRCGNCGLQQWRPNGNSQPNGEGHLCGGGGNTSIMRNRILLSNETFAFFCSTYCSTCTRQVSSETLCVTLDKDCQTHNATADIRFRLSLGWPNNWNDLDPRE
jgi:hypothetical protein